eukprot:scaffold109199_cov35-Tisochrysis_lutea.AAC.3
MARPFGVALLIAGWDLSGPTLFHTDPSGTYTKFGAKAIGAGAEGAQTALQEQYHKNLTLEEAETMAVCADARPSDTPWGHCGFCLTRKYPAVIRCLVTRLEQSPPMSIANRLSLARSSR